MLTTQQRIDIIEMPIFSNLELSELYSNMNKAHSEEKSCLEVKYFFSKKCIELVSMIRKSSDQEHNQDLSQYYLKLSTYANNNALTLNELNVISKSAHKKSPILGKGLYNKEYLPLLDDVICNSITNLKQMMDFVFNNSCKYLAKELAVLQNIRNFAKKLNVQLSDLVTDTCSYTDLVHKLR